MPADITKEGFDALEEELEKKLQKYSLRTFGRRDRVKPVAASSRPNGPKLASVGFISSDEDFRPQAAITQQPKGFERIKPLRETPCPGLHIVQIQELRGRCRSDSARGDCGPFGAPKNHFELCSFGHASQFDAYCTEESLWMGSPQHREMHCQPVSSSRCHSRSDPFDVWQEADEQQWVGERGSIAVCCFNRGREPGELAAGPSRTPRPRVVTPVEAQAFECGVVLARAVGAAGAELRNVDLSYLVEPRPPVRSEHIGQTRHHPRTHDDLGTVCSGMVVEVEQFSHISNAVPDGDNVLAGRYTDLSERCVAPRPRREHDNGRITWNGGAVMSFNQPAERSRSRSSDARGIVK